MCVCVCARAYGCVFGRIFLPNSGRRSILVPRVKSGRTHWKVSQLQLIDRDLTVNWGTATRRRHALCAIVRPFTSRTLYKLSKFEALSIRKARCGSPKWAIKCASDFLSEHDRKIEERKEREGEEIVASAHAFGRWPDTIGCFSLSLFNFLATSHRCTKYRAEKKKTSWTISFQFYVFVESVQFSRVYVCETKHSSAPNGTLWTESRQHCGTLYVLGYVCSSPSLLAHISILYVRCTFVGQHCSTAFNIIIIMMVRTSRPTMKNIARSPQ